MAEDTDLKDSPFGSNRNKRGQFVKGNSGNPTGRPKKKRDKTLQELCKTHSVEAINTLVTIMKSDEVKEADRIKAAKEVLDRAYGRPRQTVEQVVEVHNIDMPVIELPAEDALLPDEDTLH